MLLAPVMKRRESLKPPSIEPRLNKSAALRSGQSVPGNNTLRPALSTNSLRSDVSRASSRSGSHDIENITSTRPAVNKKPPSIAPRLNKSAALRQAKSDATALHNAGKLVTKMQAQPAKQRVEAIPTVSVDVE